MTKFCSNFGVFCPPKFRPRAWVFFPTQKFSRSVTTGTQIDSGTHTSRGDGFPAGSLANSHHGAFAKTRISAPSWRLRCASLTQKTQSFWGKACCPGGSYAEWIPEATRGRQETAPRNDFFAFFSRKKTTAHQRRPNRNSKKTQKKRPKSLANFSIFFGIFLRPGSSRNGIFSLRSHWISSSGATRFGSQSTPNPLKMPTD